MNRGKKIIQSIVRSESLDSDLIPGVPIIEICGQHRLLIENHLGVIGYGCNEIRVKARYGNICVCGQNLKLTRMSKVKLVITGRICGVDLQGRG